MKKRIREKVETVVERVEFIEAHLSDEMVGDRILRKAILIHGYDTVHDEIAYHAIEELVEDLKAFSAVVLEWIRN